MSTLDLSALREAAKTLDRGRSQRRRADDGEALDAWRALVSGRWSLIEHFESDGRRYLVARRNPPGCASTTTLTPLEAQALVLRAHGAAYKHVAHEIAVSVATAHRLVQTGTRKLGIRNETELPMFIRACSQAASCASHDPQR